MAGEDTDHSVDPGFTDTDLQRPHRHPKTVEQGAKAIVPYALITGDVNSSVSTQYCSSSAAVTMSTTIGASVLG
jgi:hypothetical protein